MTRLVTTGWETGKTNESPWENVGTPTIETSIVHGGGNSVKTTASETYVQALNGNFWKTLDRHYYFGAYFYLESVSPGAATDIVQLFANNIRICEIVVSKTGTLQLKDKSVQIGSDSAALVKETWFALECHLMIPTAGSGVLEARLNGTLFASSSSAAVNNSVANNTRCRLNSNTGGLTAYVDDFALNDGTGEAETSWPFTFGKTVELKAAQSLTTTLTAVLSRTAIVRAAQSMVTTVTASLSRSAVIRAAQSLTTTITASISRTALLSAAQSMTSTLTAKLSRTAIVHAAQSLTTTVTATVSRTAVVRTAVGMVDTITAKLALTARLHAALEAINQIAVNLTTSSKGAPNRLRVREPVPMRQYILATTPRGKTERWGEDESYADQVIEGLTDSDTVPGGYKELSCSLARKPNVEYGDMQRGTKIELFGAGQLKVGEYRLTQAPRTSGDKLVMDPAAVGYQAHLSDDESAQAIPIDADMSAWGEVSTLRKITFEGYAINHNAPPALLPAGDPLGAGVPAISQSWTHMDNRGGEGNRDASESWYDANGIEVGQVHCDFVNVKGVGSPDFNWVTRVGCSSDSIGSPETGIGADLQTVGTMTFSGVTTLHASGAVASAGKRFLVLMAFYGPAILEDGNWELQWRNVRVMDRSGLPLYGTWPDIGVLASDVIAYALSRWAPLLTFTTGSTGTVRPTSFPIPHLPFKEPTTVAEMITQSNRFELNEWGVWNDQTFYLNPRGQREGRKRWRARVRPTQLKETGPSMDRVFNGVLVQYQDVDGSTRVVAPTGSGYPLSSDRLLDTDPLNPANQVPGLRKWTKIAMKGISTELGALETGERFLEQTKLLDGSGEATINGYVEDEHGMLWPYYMVHSGDLIDFVDSSNSGDRYIVSATRNRASRSTTIALDAPPDSIESLMERLAVEFATRGL